MYCESFFFFFSFFLLLVSAAASQFGSIVTSLDFIASIAIPDACACQFSNMAVRLARSLAALTLGQSLPALQQGSHLALFLVNVTDCAAVYVSRGLDKPQRTAGVGPCASFKLIGIRT